LGGPFGPTRAILSAPAAAAYSCLSSVMVTAKFLKKLLDAITVG
jgi:hypothetical protein